MQKRKRHNPTNLTWVVLGVSLWSAVVLWPGSIYLFAAQAKQVTNTNQACLEAAKKSLGPQAEVLKCGDLTGNNTLEAVVAIRLKQLKESVVGIPVSKLVVLRRENSGWTPELTIDRNSTKNTVGYVAQDFINDTPSEIGFRVLFSEGNHIQLGEDIFSYPGFTIGMTYLSPNGQLEGVGIDITWNQAVGRFQEFSGESFQPEKRDLPHVKIK